MQASHHHDKADHDVAQADGLGYETKVDKGLYDHILSPKMARRLTLKMDLRILPYLTILYLLAFLDR